MSTIKIRRKNALMIAHRGLSGREAENTNAAFVAAGQHSYFGVETDVRRTGDGKFVLSHDKDLVRTAGMDLLVEETPLEKLQKVILYDTDGTKGRADLRPSTPENYVDICKKYGKKCVLEFKDDFTPAELDKILAIIDERDWFENMIFIGYGKKNFSYIRGKRPHANIQILAKEWSEELEEYLIQTKTDLDIRHTALTKEIVEKVHSHGLKVNAWTVDDPARAEELISWGVDFITTNILE